MSKNILRPLDPLKTEITEPLSAAVFLSPVCSTSLLGLQITGLQQLIAFIAHHSTLTGAICFSSLLLDVKPSADVALGTPAQQALALMLLSLVAMLAPLISFFRFSADSQRHSDANYTP